MLQQTYQNCILVDGFFFAIPVKCKMSRSDPNLMLVTEFLDFFFFFKFRI